MDVWTKEQVENMRQIGNIKSNEVYNPDVVRNPPPTNMIDAERDSDLEKFIRDKYEFKRFAKPTDRSAVVATYLGLLDLPHLPSLPPATSTPAEPTRAPTMPLRAPTGTTVARSVSQPISPQAQLQSSQAPVDSVWSDLATLQSRGPTQTSTLPLQYLSSTTLPPVPVPTSHLNAGLTPHGPSFGVSVSQGMDTLGTSVATRPVQPPFVAGTYTINPFAQMAAQQQAQVQAPQNSFPSTSPFGSSHPQQPSFAPQPQIPQIQQPAFSQSVINPFFNATTPSQGTLSPQPQAPFMSSTPSPGPFRGSPFQQPPQIPFQQPQPLFQQPTQVPFQPQPPQFGNVQSSSHGATVAGNPFTSWLTQPPNSYASTHVGQGSGQWGAM
ncbi:hypothetical protein BJV78DRAFT_1281426 [Lactifluus subvellereus]|nr:hypothetical protein BJV78DRAFT_1281426 [Lactifluus subvellereus]